MSDTSSQAETDVTAGRTRRTVRLLGVPFNLGADRRGVDIGPTAIRYAGVRDKLAAGGVGWTDAGDLDVPTMGLRSDGADGDAKYLPAVRDVTTEVADSVAETLADGQFPLVLGGDHSIAVGTMRGSARAVDALGVVWLDAHGDFNTPSTSPSGNVHGMPLAAVHGHAEFADADWATTPAIPEANTAVVGVRNLDRGERIALRDSDATVYTMEDVDRRGITTVLDEALDVATDGTDGVHVSLDLDWLDPSDAPGVGTPVRGGVTYREACAAAETIATRHRSEGVLRSLDVVEVNPILDDTNRTAEVAADLAATALGKTII